MHDPEKLEEFDKRITEIHQSDDVEDVRKAELKAMFDTFLGEGEYDPEKLEQVSAIQDGWDKRHAELNRRLDEGKIGHPEFLEEVNVGIAEIIPKIKEVLGEEDLIKVFGSDEFRI
jgi:hypothetical protein